MKIEPTTIDTELRITRRCNAHIKSEEEWRKFLQDHEIQEEIQLSTEINFDEVDIIGVFLGEQSTAGYSVEIDSCEITEGTLKINVNIETANSNSDSLFAAQVLTYPFALASIPKPGTTNTVFNFI